ncbi:MAG: hypothetical protein NT116_05225, partial [Candidatus Parcubacteria bacterium]|nr:hypothetical protein [Candidatus Parcubacteria bacterium]
SCMPTNKEITPNFPHKESEFEKLSKSKKAQGWDFMGQERLTMTKFSSKDALFLEVPFQTETQIKEKYLNLAKKQAPSHKFEVELILDENTEKLVQIRKISTEEEYINILNNLRDEDKNYFVFIRKMHK